MTKRLWTGCLVLFIGILSKLTFRNAPSIVASFFNMTTHVEIGIIISWVIVADIMKFHSKILL